jgi:hypothetical protein
MITQNTLVKKWGISAGAISKMVKRGMPLQSESDAENWRMANQKRVGRGGGKLKNPVKIESTKVQEEEGDWISPYARIKMAEQALLEANAMLKNSSAEGNAVAMRAAVDSQINAQKSLIIAEEAKENHDLRKRNTLAMGEVKEFISTWFGAIRNLMDAMPSSLSARANPSDPECAKVAIQEGVDQIFITIQKAEGEFK